MRIIPFVTNTIIAPHGITDLSHSIQTSNIPNLLKIYGLNFTLTNLIVNNFSINYINNILLIASSIVHFRHDFPKIKINNNIIPRFILSSLMILLFLHTNLNFLILYMTIIHVPNHIRINFFHINKKKMLNIFLFVLTGFIFNELFENLDTFYQNKFIVNNIKSMIISHVIYQEKYILNNYIS